MTRLSRSQMALSLVVIATPLATHCSAPVGIEPPRATSTAVASVIATPGSTLTYTSDADPSTRAAPLAPSASPLAPSASPASSARVNWMPNWTHNGSMVLRCENAFPPEDGSGKCMCEGVELNPCVDGIRQLAIDRKQCTFTCRPKPQTAKEIAVRCPDGSNPEASAAGCECSGRKPLDPCTGGMASARLTAGECVATCKKAQ